MSQRLLGKPLFQARVGALKRFPVVQGVRDRRVESINLANAAYAATIIQQTIERQNTKNENVKLDTKARPKTPKFGDGGGVYTRDTIMGIAFDLHRTTRNSTPKAAVGRGG